MNGRLPPDELDRRIAELMLDRKHEMAQFLAACGWTQEELAGRMGRTQAWVSRQMLFGRFLDFITKVIELGDDDDRGSITTVIKVGEARFNALWRDTDRAADEAARFVEVQQLLGETKDLEARPSRAVADKLMARYANGKWHALDAIAASIEAPRATVQATLDTLERAPYRAKVEVKTVGIRPTYRIFHADRMIRLSELKEKFGPFIADLKQQGNTNAATVSIGAVKHCAHRLQQIIDEWSQ
jgi:hypothetical protein